MFSEKVNIQYIYIYIYC